MSELDEFPEIQIRELISKLVRGFDVPFGVDQRGLADRIAGLCLAARGRRLAVVELAVEDFLSGAVDRPRSRIGSLPSGDEFGSHIRYLEKSGRVEGEQIRANANGELMEYAAPLGPLWAAGFMSELLAGAKPIMSRPPSFIASQIAAGGELGERRRLQHQAANGFPLANVMLDRASWGKGWAVKASIAHLAAMTEPVAIGAPTWSEWQTEFDCRGWPWFPDLGSQRVVYLPRGGVSGLAAFEEAVAARPPPDGSFPTQE